jgi:hypothetical protein
MLSFRPKVFTSALLSFIVLIPAESLTPCFPREDATASVLQLKVPAKARQAFAESPVAGRNKDDHAAKKALAKALQIAPDYAAALTMKGLLGLENSLEEADRNISALPCRGLRLLRTMCRSRHGGKCQAQLRRSRTAHANRCGGVRKFVADLLRTCGITDWQRAVRGCPGHVAPSRHSSRSTESAASYTSCLCPRL